LQGRHRAAQQECGSDRSGMSCHSMPIMKKQGKKVSREYRGKCSRYSNGGSERREAREAGSLSPSEVFPKNRRNSARLSLAPPPLSLVAVRSVPYFAVEKVAAMLSTQPARAPVRPALAKGS
jgi:hypothetical protein